jgi:hypothetical protein
MVSSEPRIGVDVVEEAPVQARLQLMPGDRTLRNGVRADEDAMKSPPR